MHNTTSVSFALVAVFAACGSAFAAIDATTAVQTPMPGATSTLQLTDGSWDRAIGVTLGTAGPDDDFGFPDATTSVMWMRENWVGGAGSSAGFNTSFGVADAGGRSTPFPINLLKEVTNNGGFFADGFVIELTETGGSSIANVFANPVADVFDDVSIVTVGPTTTITYGLGTGSGLADGQTVVFDFGFEIDSGISFNIVQTLVPSPGAASLLGLAGLAALRRGRA